MRAGYCFAARSVSMLQNLEKLSRRSSSFSVNLEGVGSGGVQSLLTAPRGINPGAVASIGPCELIFLGRKRRCSSVNTGATGRISVATPTAYD
jgi:hypothetical protein